MDVPALMRRRRGVRRARREGGSVMVEMMCVLVFVCEKGESESEVGLEKGGKILEFAHQVYKTIPYRTVHEE